MTHEQKLEHELESIQKEIEIKKLELEQLEEKKKQVVNLFWEALLVQLLKSPSALWEISNKWERNKELKADGVQIRLYDGRPTWDRLSVHADKNFRGAFSCNREIAEAVLAKYKALEASK